MATWVTSDTHFNHQNILEYEQDTRPFNSVEEMNETLIKNWNERVKPEDTVIHCGDFFMGPLSGIDEILPRLNGHIILVRGNHDSNPRLKKYAEYGVEVKDIHYLGYKGLYFVFCHFPFQNEEMAKMMFQDNGEVVWCYGHIHSKAPKGYVNHSYHVGVDTNDMAPIALKQIREEVNTAWGLVNH